MNNQKRNNKIGKSEFKPRDGGRHYTEEDEETLASITWENLGWKAGNWQEACNHEFPESPVIRTIAIDLFRHEYPQLEAYEFRHPFLRLKSYDNIEYLRRYFPPMKLVNSPNLTSKYLCSSVVAYVRATCYDDIHKVVSE